MATRNRAARAKAAARAAARRDAVNPHRTALPAEAVTQRHEHARSGAAGTHANRGARRARTRAASVGRAIRESY